MFALATDGSSAFVPGRAEKLYGIVLFVYSFFLWNV